MKELIERLKKEISYIDHIESIEELPCNIKIKISKDEAKLFINLLNK